MRNYDGISAAADDAREWYLANRATLPAHLVEKLNPLMKTGTSPVDMTAGFAKAVYANSGPRKADGEADLPAEALEIAAGIADQFEQNGYHGRLDDRASGMMKALRRDSGEQLTGGRKWPKPEDDPAPDQPFAKPVQAEAPARGEGGAPNP